MMIPRLHPAETAETVLDIDFERLRSLGNEALVFDFDGTLAKRGSGAMPSVSNTLLTKLAGMGFRIGILTNRRPRRTIADVSVPIVYHARKPRRTACLALLHQLSSEPNESAMIGDRFVTDMLGGNLLGMLTIRVRRHPVDEVHWQPSGD
jgi:HAD superfamily phosphatase (TIGR01668 family)